MIQETLNTESILFQFNDEIDEILASHIVWSIIS